jgi:hypothetical protein
VPSTRGTIFNNASSIRQTSSSTGDTIFRAESLSKRWADWEVQIRSKSLPGLALRAVVYGYVTFEAIFPAELGKLSITQRVDPAIKLFFEHHVDGKKSKNLTFYPKVK